MSKYSCQLFFQYDHNGVREYLSMALNALGFLPTRMYLSPGVNTDLPYDVTDISKAIEKRPQIVQIMNGSYDEVDEYMWFRLEVLYSFSIIRLTWLNKDLSFLLEKEKLDKFLGSNRFICGHCFDNDDQFEQSREKSEDFVNTDPTDPYKIEKIERKIDVTQNPGRKRLAGGLLFAASPLSWYSKIFFQIISLERLGAFKYSSRIIAAGNDLIRIKLFDLHDNPGSPEYRKKQQEFWDFFELEKVAQAYKLKTELDPKDVFNSLLKKNDPHQ